MDKKQTKPPNTKTNKPPKLTFFLSCHIQTTYQSCLTPPSKYSQNLTTSHHPHCWLDLHLSVDFCNNLWTGLPASAFIPTCLLFPMEPREWVLKIHQLVSLHPPVASHLIQSGNESPWSGSHDLLWFLPLFSLQSLFLSFSPAHSRQPHFLLYCSSNVPLMLLTWALCIGCLLCMEHAPPFSSWLVSSPPSGLYSVSPSWMRLTWTVYLQLQPSVTSPPLSWFNFSFLP